MSTTIRLNNHCSLYYGKIPLRGDFVRSNSGTRIIPLIDAWLSRGMELLIEEPNWKLCYDNFGTINFLFIGVQKKHAICGALTPSMDSSSRRFPFVAATVFEIDDPMAFLPLSAFALEKHIGQQRGLVFQASKGQDSAEILSALVELPFCIEHSGAALSEAYCHFLENTSIASLHDALDISDNNATVRQIILAIGYLLQPILTNFRAPPQRGLMLPLPINSAWKTAIKTLWLDLISIFISRSTFELSIFSSNHLGNPRLFVGFNGVTPVAFRDLFQERSDTSNVIDICQSAWVETRILSDPAMHKLSSYLQHKDLSLKQMVHTFRQTFAG